MRTTTVSPAETPRVIPAQGNGRRVFRRKRQILDAVSAVIDAQITDGKFVQGCYVDALQRAIEARWGVGAAIAVNSGSSALRLAFEALGIEAGREVIVPALTFISTAYALSDARLVPVFVDVDPHTLTIDPVAVEAALSEKTAVIVPVHLYGQMADMSPLLDLADAYDLWVVEDAAQAHGATYTRHYQAVDVTRYAGSMGDLGCFSLNSVKNMGGLGDGGMVTVSDRLLDRHPRLVDRLRSLRDLGRTPGGARYVHDEWGLRARMDEFSAVECLLELTELEGWNQRRREIAARYSAALESSSVQAPFVAADRQHVFFTYAVRSPSTAVRQELEQSMAAAGIEVAEAHTLVPDQKLYRTGQLPCRVQSLDVARAVQGRTTHIPLYPELGEDEIERIITVLQRFALAG